MSGDTMFASRSPEKAPLNLVPWAIAGGVVLVAIVLLVVLGHGKRPSPNTVLPLDPYASSLVISSPVMSESTSLSGGKSTYIDGKVKNTGTKTVTEATVQVLFANDVALPPKVETLPLTLIRTREPYVDTQPIAAAPLAPGDEREFRLIFEGVPSNWNQQVPEIHFVSVAAR